MDKDSTLNSLVQHLYESDSDNSSPALDNQPELKEEWQAMKATREAIDKDKLASPSQTSIDIIMAYAMEREAAAPSAS